MKQLLLFVLLNLFFFNKGVSQVYTQYAIHPNEARKHIGEKKQVYGYVYKSEFRKYKPIPIQL